MIRLTRPKKLALDHLRGRVVNGYGSLFLRVTPIGSLFSGSLARVLGAPATIAIGAAISLICLIVLIIRERRQARPGL